MVEKLLNSDGEFLCGAKIKIPRNAVNAERICHSQQNTSEHRGGNKTSYDSGTSAPWSEHNGTDADQLVEGQELSAEELFDLGISYRKGGDGVVPKATLNWSASEWWPSNGKVSTAAAKASLAFHGGRCADVFSVSLELVLLPGYLNDEMGIASSDNSGRAWSTLADEHFYLFTNVLVRHLASSHLGAEAGKQQIKLSSHVTHTRGRISSYPGCASGVRKHVQYDFTFETERDAAVFRDWLKPDESKQLVEPLTRMDPAGVCGGKGDTGPVVNTRHCSTAVVGQPVKVPNSKFP